MRTKQMPLTVPNIVPEIYPRAPSVQPGDLMLFYSGGRLIGAKRMPVTVRDPRSRMIVKSTKKKPTRKPKR